jgi:hypothetical protein
VSAASKHLVFISGGDPGALDSWTTARPFVVSRAAAPAAVTALVELWGEPEVAVAELRGLGFEASACAVEEKVERWDRPLEAGGIVQVAAWKARPELSREAARQRWDEHVPLALRAHGASNYVRNWILDPAEANGFDGVAVLTYADAEDFQSRRYLFPGDAERIAADIGRFIGEFEVFLATPRGGGAPPPRSV